MTTTPSSPTPTSPVDDGGPAYPGGLFEPQHGGANDREPWNHGMSLRDWFAGQALVGIVERMNHSGDYPREVFAARMAYRYADALLTARKGGDRP